MDTRKASRPYVRSLHRAGEGRGARGHPPKPAGHPPDQLHDARVAVDAARGPELVTGAQGLRFLVFDELHTYRGRQGADVALLIRRCREASAATTSFASALPRRWRAKAPPMTRSARSQKLPECSSEPSSTRRRSSARHLNERRRRSDFTEPGDRRGADSDRRLGRGAARDLRGVPSAPVASWIETTFGVTAEQGTGRLVRQRPRRLRGNDSASMNSAGLTETDAARCNEVLRRFLTKGADLRRSESSRFPIFAFRLHQFSDSRRHRVGHDRARGRGTGAGKMVSKPGAPDQPLFPSRVLPPVRPGVLPRVLTQADGQGRADAAVKIRREERTDGQRAMYVYVSGQHPWPTGEGSRPARSVPAVLKETRRTASSVCDPTSDANYPRLSTSTRRATLPQASGTPAALIKGNFLFCLESRLQSDVHEAAESERGKLGTLGVDNRSTATTVLAVQALIQLQRDRDLSSEARKLLSFTDNRQDASLQAGHFNDFVQVALLRSALFKACE